MQQLVPVWQKLVVVISISRMMRKKSLRKILLKVWIFKNTQRLMMHESFKRLTGPPRKDVVCLHKFCWIHISKGHQRNDCKLKVQCKKCSKKHHILLPNTNNSIPEKKFL